MAERGNPFTYAHLPQKSAAQACGNILQQATGRTFTAKEELQIRKYIVAYWAGIQFDKRSALWTSGAYEACSLQDEEPSGGEVDFKDLEEGTALLDTPLCWKMMVPLSRGVAYELATNGCHSCDALVSRIPSWGGTGFLRKIPIRHAARALHVKFTFHPIPPQLGPILAPKIIQNHTPNQQKNDIEFSLGFFFDFS